MGMWVANNGERRGDGLRMETNQGKDRKRC